MPISNEREFWAVGYSPTWESWQVRKRSTTSSEYSLVEDLGSQIRTAAIEFDGDFYLPDNSTHFIEVTDSVPYLFIVTTAGELYVKFAGDDFENATLLDTNVMCISACRGFRSTNWNVDLGLVIGYVKTDGTIYYRAFEPDLDGIRRWTEAVQITDAGIGNTDIQVIRLLDFRTGIYVRGCNKLFISERAYIGDTIKSETIECTDDTDFVITAFRNVTEDPLDEFAIERVNLLNPSTIEVQANYPVFDFDPTWEDITMLNATAEQDIDYLSWENGNLYIHLKTPATSQFFTARFLCRGGNRKGYKVSDQCLQLWPEVEFQLPPGELDITERINTQVSLVTALNFVEIVERPVTFRSETIDTTLTLTPQLNFVEIVESEYALNPETIDTELTLTTVISFTQTGVQPI